MTGTGMQSHRLSWKDQTIEYLKLVAAIWGSLVVISGGLWWLGGDKIQVLMQEFVGTADLRLEVSSLSALAMDNAAAIRRLTPPPEVSEYDTLRSQVWTPCVRGKICEYQFRTRRTDFGKPCSTPEVLARVVTDKSGLLYYVTAPGQIAGRTNGEWAMVTSSFITPEDAPVGVAQFHLVLGYDCGAQHIEEATPRLVFEIVSTDP